MKRILHNSDLGFYTQTFFRIHLYKNVTFNHMSEEDYAVLAHEYIHFLQDISTTYGAFMAYSSSEYMRSVASAIRNSEDGIIDVPFTPEIDSSNVYANFHLLEYTYGNSDEIKTIKEIVELRNCMNS